MSDGWTKDFEEAQAQTRHIIAGQESERICYGNEAEDWGAHRGTCHDCGVAKDQYHLIGCDVERCPKCVGQAIYCECEDAKD